MKEITGSHSQPPDDQEAKQAVRMLWSADEAVREAGRREILRIGSATAAPLIQLLADLLQDPRPRFAAAKEEEGRKALADYVEWIRKTQRPPEIGSKVLQAVHSFVINYRLNSDAISLLGELRAVEAIPLLIHIMENILPQAAGMEVDALCRIGAPAVPFLIKSIENARVSAREWDPVRLGFYVEIDMGDAAGDEAVDQLDASELDDPDFEQEQVKWVAGEIKRKAITALAEIGDKEALPFLESLSKAEEHQDVVANILSAIRGIKNEPSTSTGPSPVQCRRRPITQVADHGRRKPEAT